MDPGSGDPNLTYNDMQASNIHAMLLPFLMRLRMGMGGGGGVDPGFYKDGSAVGHLMPPIPRGGFGGKLHYPEDDGPFPSGGGGGAPALFSAIQGLGGVVDGALGGHIPARTGAGGIHGTPPHAPTQGYAPGGVNYKRPGPVASRGGYAGGGVTYGGVRSAPQGNPMLAALRQAALRARAGMR